MSGQIIKSKVEVITPIKAKAFLDSSSRNRTISPDRINKYANEMKAGRWDLNGESIIISENGRLLNGFHRMLAVIQAGRAINALVVSGVAEESFATMDTGATRSYADVLSIRGTEQSALLSSTTREYWSWIKGTPHTFGRYGSPTVQELDNVLAEHPDLMKSVSFVIEGPKQRGLMPPRVFACLHYIFSGIDSLQADDFITRLRSGTDLNALDPVYVLRERLLSIEAKNLHTRGKSAITIKAWNACRRGVPIRVLRFISRGSMAESFPKPI